MAQLQASCSCSCFLKSISHLLPFAGRSESRLEQLLHEHLRKSSGQKAAETLPLWWEQLSARRSQFSIQHHKMRTTGFAWAEVHIPACHPAPRWSVLSLQFECCHPTSWRKKNKPIMSNPFSISLIRANSGNSESYRTDWKTKSCCYQPNQTPISSSLLLSVGHQYLTQFEIPVAKIKTHYLT